MELPKTKEQFKDFVKLTLSPQGRETIEANGMNILSIIIGGNISPAGTPFYTNKEFVDILKTSGISTIKPESLAKLERAGMINDLELEKTIISSADRNAIDTKKAEEKINNTSSSDKSQVSTKDIEKVATQQSSSNNNATPNKKNTELNENLKEIKKNCKELIAQNISPTNSEKNKEYLEKFLLSDSTIQSSNSNIRETENIILNYIHEGTFSTTVIYNMLIKHTNIQYLQEIKNDLQTRGYFKFMQKDDTAPTTSTGIKRLECLCNCLSNADSQTYIVENVKNKVDACINFVQNDLVTLKDIEILHEKGILTEKDLEDIRSKDTTKDEIVNQASAEENIIETGALNGGVSGATISDKQREGNEQQEKIDNIEENISQADSSTASDLETEQPENENTNEASSAENCKDDELIKTCKNNAQTFLDVIILEQTQESDFVKKMLPNQPYKP